MQSHIILGEIHRELHLIRNIYRYYEHINPHIVVIPTAEREDLADVKYFHSTSEVLRLKKYLYGPFIIESRAV